MATKTLIRSKKPHEVKLVDGTQLAQSQQPLAGEEVPVPALIRKASATSAASSRRSAKVAGTPASAAGSTKAAVRKKPSVAAAPAARSPKKAAPKAPAKDAAKAATKPAAKPAAKKVPSPRLPARVPADGLWETDSAVNQRLQALIERNAQLSEQLQRIQSNALPKGYKP